MILVKNLPAGVVSSELEELFSAHGSLERVLLPPSGLTAIVEFLEPTEAKRAFTRLAYSKVCSTFYKQSIPECSLMKVYLNMFLYVKTVVPTCAAVFRVGACGRVCGSQTRTRAR